MQRYAVALALVIVLAVVCGSPAQTTTTVPAAAPLPQETKVSGTPPRLDGRWLVLVTLGTAAAPRRAASLWHAARVGESLVLSERFVRLPDPMQKALEKGGWSPTPADLAEIARRSDALEPDARGIAEVRHEVFGRDGFDDQLKQDAMTGDAFWVVRQVYGFVPGGSRPIRQVNLYAANADVDGVLRGRYVGVTVAAAPFPIPIKLEGTFELFPLDPPRSFWSRLDDVFKGCNR